MKNITPPRKFNFTVRKFYFLIFSLALVSCFFEDQHTNTVQPLADFVDPEIVKTPEDKRKAEAILTVTNILRKIYTDCMVVEEVNAAIASGYYEDETVLLWDLLNPESSPIYKLEEFNKRKQERGFQVGTFKKQFEKEVGIDIQSNFRMDNEYFENNSISIYFPYHENTQYNNNIVAVVPSTVEADFQYIPMTFGPEPDMFNGHNYHMLINDDYAAQFITHIVGAGAVPVIHYSHTPCEGPFRVNVGYVKIMGNQYDKLISFTGNHGGAELMFISAKARSGSPGTITRPDRVRGPKYVKRRDIRNHNWVPVWEELDFQWSSTSIDQLFGIYEWDNTSERKNFTGTLEFNGLTSNYNIQAPTKDPLVNTEKQWWSTMLYYHNLFGQSAEYQSGYGQQFTSTDGFVVFSLPITCMH